MRDDTTTITARYELVELGHLVPPELLGLALLLALLLGVALFAALSWYFLRRNHQERPRSN